MSLAYELAAIGILAAATYLFGWLVYKDGYRKGYTRGRAVGYAEGRASKGLGERW